MTKSLPEPLMLDGKPHYTARQIAEMRLPGMPGTRRRVNARALSESWSLPPPLGSRRREGVFARSPAGRGAGENPPTCTAQTHATRSCGLSLHPEEAERQKAPLSRARAGSEGEGRGEGRGGRPVETIQDANLPREVSIPDAGKAFCTLWKAGQARAEERHHKALPAFAASPLPAQTGTGLWRGAV